MCVCVYIFRWVCKSMGCMCLVCVAGWSVWIKKVLITGKLRDCSPFKTSLHSAFTCVKKCVYSVHANVCMRACVCGYNMPVACCVGFNIVWVWIYIWVCSIVLCVSVWAWICIWVCSMACVCACAIACECASTCVVCVAGWSVWIKKRVITGKTQGLFTIQDITPTHLYVWYKSYL